MITRFYYLLSIFLSTALVFTSCAEAQSPAPSMPLRSPAQTAVVLPTPVTTVPSLGVSIKETATQQIREETVTTTSTSLSSGAMPTAVDWLATVTIEGDYYILGNPNAPIRLIDYSDFL